MAEKRTSAEIPAGTGHYHALRATELWAAFAEQMIEKATRTAADREHRERDRLEDTTYHREANPPTAGG
jgi:hypothetical protein